eukprot:512378-Pyramimonas_sp.AAC.1
MTDRPPHSDLIASLTPPAHFCAPGGSAQEALGSFEFSEAFGGVLTWSLLGAPGGFLAAS